MVNFIPENIISDIQTTANIVDIVSEFVMLKKAGKDFQGLCPFHSEKTPSFTVSPSKQMFYCFGCSTGGTVFHFLMKYEGISFPDAVRKLAHRYGIEISDQTMSPEQKQRMHEREQLIRINKEAAYFFYNELKQKITGREALSYLGQRQIKHEIIDKFLIGFAPLGWDNLLKYLSNKGFSQTIMHMAGLIIPRKNSPGYYDRFRNRIIFPIINIQGQITGFGGRVMDESLPKYLNSPETPVFNKSRTLYGINTARQKSREMGLIYMTEGYFDVISLYACGIENAVASLGTSLTDDHVRLLKGIVRQVVLVFDSDQAGVRAATKSIETFRKQNMDIKVLILPKGHDPDSFVREFDSKAFKEKAEKAKPAMTFLMDESVKKHGMSVEARLRIIEDMKNHLASINDPVARSLYNRELADRLGVDETMLHQRIGQNNPFPQHPQPPGHQAHQRWYPQDQHIQHHYPQNHAHQPQEPENRVFYNKQAPMEKRLISIMLQFPEILPEIETRSILDYFEDPILKSLGLIILSRYKDHSQGKISDIINVIEDKERQSLAASLAMKTEKWHPKGWSGLLAQFELGHKRRSDNLLQQIEAAQRENNHDLLFKLLRQKQEQEQARERQSIT